MASNTPVFETIVTIRETLLDTFGHINNAKYLELFEDARWEIIQNRGYGLKRVHELQQGPTILEINMKFQKEIRNRETITIRTTLGASTNKTQVLRQAMVNEKGEEACVAEFVVGLFDMKTRRLIEPTPEWKVALGLK